jgi:hypothetical protein
VEVEVEVEVEAEVEGEGVVDVAGVVEAAVDGEAEAEAAGEVEAEAEAAVRAPSVCTRRHACLPEPEGCRGAAAVSRKIRTESKIGQRAGTGDLIRFPSNAHGRSACKNTMCDIAARTDVSIWKIL